VVEESRTPLPHGLVYGEMPEPRDVVHPKYPKGVAEGTPVSIACPLEVLVGADGALLEAVGNGGPEPLFGAAPKAVGQWKWIPASVDGEDVVAEHPVTIASWKDDRSIP
jgi:hypothetical protein